jgi:hypothetical protein
MKIGLVWFNDLRLHHNETLTEVIEEHTTKL